MTKNQVIERLREKLEDVLVAVKYTQVRLVSKGMSTHLLGEIERQVNRTLEETKEEMVIWRSVMITKEGK